MSTSMALAALMAALLSQAAAATRWAADSGDSPRVGIFLDFDRTPSPSSLQAMQREVAAVLLGTGARFSWMMMNTDFAAETFDDLAVLRFHGSCRAGALKPAPPAGERMTLGATEVAAHGVTAYSSVECAQIQVCVAGVLCSFRPGERDEVFGRAMGRVVAHELFHILGRTTGHTHAGLTQALQTPFDLVRRDFQLDRQTLLWLRERLQSKKGAGPPSDLAARPTTIALGARF